MGYKPDTQRAALLDELCVTYGLCTRLADAALADARTADEGLDIVLRAEGIQPETYDRQMRRVLLRVVEDWLFDPQGRGAASGMPW